MIGTLSEHGFLLNKYPFLWYLAMDTVGGGRSCFDAREAGRGKGGLKIL